MKDLRSFLKEIESDHRGHLLRVKRSIDPGSFDMSAILEHLDRRGDRPAVLFERPLNLFGEESTIPLLVNVFAERSRCAIALGCAGIDSRLPLSLEYSKLNQHPIPPLVVSRDDAPVKELVRLRDELDTRELPIAIHSEGDYGPCLTMTLATKDPKSGAYNASFIKAFYDFDDPRRLRITIHSPDTERTLAYYESRNEPMPIVAILGHHPAFYLGTMGLTAYDTDDYHTIGGFLDEPLRLVASETWGDDFLVPADAEIVIEGEVPPGTRMIADPFGDITRQYQAQTLRPVMNVTAITRRKDAILQDVFAGHRDHMTVGQIPKEGTVFNNLRKRFGDLVTAVHLPYSGCGRLLCYVAINKTQEGQAKSVGLMTLMESWTFQTVVIVDHTIDVFNESDVIWSIMINVDPSRDVDVINNIPILFTTSLGSRKVLIDATRPTDRSLPDVNRVPQEALDRIRLEDYLEEHLVEA